MPDTTETEALVAAARGGDDVGHYLDSLWNSSELNSAATMQLKRLQHELESTRNDLHEVKENAVKTKRELQDQLSERDAKLKVLQEQMREMQRQLRELQSCGTPAKHPTDKALKSTTKLRSKVRGVDA